MVFQACSVDGCASAASEVGLCVAVSRACSAGETSGAKSAASTLGSKYCVRQLPATKAVTSVDEQAIIHAYSGANDGALTYSAEPSGRR